MVGGHTGGGVIGRAVIIGNFNDSPTERGGDAAGEGVAGDGEGRAAEEAGGTDGFVRQWDERVDRSTAGVLGQGRQSLCAREVEDDAGGIDRQRARHLGDGCIRGGDEHGVDVGGRRRAVVASTEHLDNGEANGRECRGEGRAGPTVTDDGDAWHWCSLTDPALAVPVPEIPTGSEHTDLRDLAVCSLEEADRHEFRGQICEGGEDERPLPHPWVRHGQCVAVT